MRTGTFILALLLMVSAFAEPSGAAVVSRKDLEAIEVEVEQKSVEHKRLQAQAAKVSVETVKQWLAAANEKPDP